MTNYCFYDSALDTCRPQCLGKSVQATEAVCFYLQTQTAWRIRRRIIGVPLKTEDWRKSSWFQTASNTTKTSLAPIPELRLAPALCSSSGGFKRRLRPRGASEHYYWRRRQFDVEFKERMEWSWNSCNWTMDIAIQLEWSCSALSRPYITERRWPLRRPSCLEDGRLNNRDRSIIEPHNNIRIPNPYTTWVQAGTGLRSPWEIWICSLSLIDWGLLDIKLDQWVISALLERGERKDGQRKERSWGWSAAFHNSRSRIFETRLWNARAKHH